jgi:hypothetical protein
MLDPGGKSRWEGEGNGRGRRARQPADTVTQLEELLETVRIEAELARGVKPAGTDLVDVVKALAPLLSLIVQYISSSKAVAQFVSAQSSDGGAVGREAPGLESQSEARPRAQGIADEVAAERQPTADALLAGLTALGEAPLGVQSDQQAEV